MPDDLGVRRDFALATYSLGNVDEARDDMQSIVNAGGNAGQVVQDARRFLSLTQPEQTAPTTGALENEARQALQADPGYIPALMIRGALQRQRGETQPATATYVGVLLRAPDFLPAQKRLAEIYLSDAATRDKAYELAQKARKAAPNDPEAAELLGEAAYNRKEYSYALQLLQESTRHRPPTAGMLYEMGMCYLQTKQNVPAREALTKALAAGLSEPMASEAKQALAEPTPAKGS